jgi:hypothetical protein
MSRDHLAAALFGLPQSPSESQKRFAAAAATLILKDLITQCAKHASREGPGALVVAIAENRKERSTWATSHTLHHNLAIAEELNDTAMADVHRRLLERLGCIDTSTTALLLLLERDGDGHGTARVYELDIDRDPAAAAAAIREIG